MDFISLIDLEQYLLYLINNYHDHIYLILLIAIFTETGLVIASFPPGDAVVFLIDSLSGAGILNIYILAIAVFIGVFIGDNSSFFIGRFLGKKFFDNPSSKVFRYELFIRAQSLYKDHAGKTVFLGRFIPILRSFTPLVAGISHMPYPIFASLNCISVFLWVTILLGTGFIFGNLPFIKNNLSLIILLTIILSLLYFITLIYRKCKEIANQ